MIASSCSGETRLGSLFPGSDYNVTQEPGNVCKKSHKKTSGLALVFAELVVKEDILYAHQCNCFNCHRPSFYNHKHTANARKVL